MVLGYDQADLTAEEDEHVLSEIPIHTVFCHCLWRGQNPIISGNHRSCCWILPPAKADRAGKSKLCCYIAGQVVEHLYLCCRI